MSRGKEFTDEILETFQKVEYLLNGMMNDRGVPRNIKRIAQRCIDQLHRDDDSPAVLSSNVMYMIDDLSQDPNIPFHSRTTIYRIISLLEKIKD
ncbi:MAG: hypothetical protein EAX89_06115 [Candidatus Lokiarchaeota archaeon]|nr:hypothetical protein [Candidatus Lokiarchaeota archaeon]